MNVTYFKRGDNLSKTVKNSDIVVDVLSSNPTSKGLLNKNFFDSVKKGAMFLGDNNDVFYLKTSLSNKRASLRKNLLTTFIFTFLIMTGISIRFFTSNKF